MAGILALAMFAANALGLPQTPPCEPLGDYRITGYVRGHHSSLTFDETSVWTTEKIVAASWNVPIGTIVRVEGLDYSYRVADRGGGLEARHIDVLVSDIQTAYKISEWVGGKYAAVCTERWGYGK